MKTAIIILNYNDIENTERLSKILNKYEVIDKIVVVDNCSPNCDYEKLLKLQGKKIDVIKSDKNGGYSYGNNYGLQYLEQHYGIFDYIIISNPDIEIEETAIISAIDFLRTHHDVALAAPRVVDLKGNKYLLSGWKFRSIWEDTVLQSEIMTKKYIKQDLLRLYPKKERDQKYAYADCISGCFFIIKGSIFKKIGYFDDYLFIYGEEDILGKKLHSIGYRAAVLNYIKVVHYESVSIKKSFRRRKQLKQLHRSLHYYYKKYDESVTLLQLFRFDFIYYFGCLEYYLKNNKLIRKMYLFVKKICLYIKKIIHKVTKFFKRYNFYHNPILKNGKKNILFIVHKWNDNFLDSTNIGGSLYNAIDILKNILDEYNVLVMYPVENCYHMTFYDQNHYITFDDGYVSPDFSLNNPNYDCLVTKLIKKCNIDIVHIHSLIGHYTSVIKIAKQCNKKVVFSLHDFYPFCLNYFLLNKKDKYCHFDLKQCKDCISRFYDYKILKNWRIEMQKVLQISDYVIAPSQYLKDIFEKLYKNLNICVIEHRLDCKSMEVGNLNDNEPLRIAFLGGISKIKGSLLLLKLVNLNRVKHCPIEIHLFGISDLQELNQSTEGYVYHGQYRRQDLFKLMKKNKINLTCIFSIIPETYSYTLSEAVLFGTPILGINLGAVGERIKDNNIGWILSEDISVEKIFTQLQEIKKNKKDYNIKRKQIKKYQLELQDTKKMTREYKKLYEKNNL